jgi:hypothetical protein
MDVRIQCLLLKKLPKWERTLFCDCDDFSRLFFTNTHTVIVVQNCN